MAMYFTKSFTQQARLPEESLKAAQRVLLSAGLHRYQPESDGLGETSLLEAEFAAWQGSRYCVAVASGGQAIQLALRAVGVGANSSVLTNAFTLAPVPGAIRAVGGLPVLVETTEELVIDLKDLEAKAANSGAKTLLLSLMRGHLPDMDAVMALARKYDLKVVEDCAHTMGATWRGEKSGNFGAVGCFSSQTYKHINSGEGGFLTTDDPHIAARAVIMSGSYMNFDRHGAAPSAVHFDQVRYEDANMSARMDNLRAAILRPQIKELSHLIEAWNVRHEIISQALSPLAPAILQPHPLPGAMRVGSSLQFRIPSLSYEDCSNLVTKLARRGVDVKWFGNSNPKGFTSQHSHWKYFKRQVLPKTDEVLRTLFDMRVPLSFSKEDCRDLGVVLFDVLNEFVPRRPQ